MNILFSPINNFYNRATQIAKRQNVSFGFKDDIFSKSRNGHLRVDTFDKTTNTLDIRYNGLYPANVLSNLSPNEFNLDGIHCASLEGFLQSLKTPDIEEQIRICGAYGGSAKKTSKKNQKWKDDGIVYWKGKEYKRDSKEYEALIFRAFYACWKQNTVYSDALKRTKGVQLSHVMGKTDQKDTILTQTEFIKILNKLRKD